MSLWSIVTLDMLWLWNALCSCVSYAALEPCCWWHCVELMLSGGRLWCIEQSFLSTLCLPGISIKNITKFLRWSSLETVLESFHFLNPFWCFLLQKVQMLPSGFQVTRSSSSLTLHFWAYSLRLPSSSQGLKHPEPPVLSCGSMQDSVHSGFFTNWLVSQPTYSAF